MTMVKLCLQPGDKVRLKQDIGQFYEERPFETYLHGTKGSIGTVVSYEEYRIQKNKGRSAAHLAELEDFYQRVKWAIDDCEQYPVRLETVLPPEKPVDGVFCEVGKIEVYDVFYLEKIE